MSTNKYGDYKALILAGSGGCGDIYVVENIYEIIPKKAYILKTLKGNMINIVNIHNLQNEIDILIKLNQNPRSNYIPILYGYDKDYIPGKLQDKKVENNNIILNEYINKIRSIRQTRPYYVIDYFSKGNLYYYIENTKIGFPEKYARVIFKKILEGFKFCHNRKICHLDIKPGNIVLDEKFEPIIIDFGFSEIYKDEKDQIIYSTKLKGTDMYKPPEMWEAKPCNGAKCDIFSLGAFLFKLVTNKNPFKKYAKIEDEYYSKILKETDVRNGTFKEYWDCMNENINVQLSDNFKHL